MVFSPDRGVGYRFRGWELLPSQRRLLVDGVAVEIGARAFDLLQALVERRERIVGKDELMAAAWPGRVVEENNISVQIAALRRLIGPQAITTVPGVGYRLTAEPDPQVEPQAEQAAPALAPAARPAVLEVSPAAEPRRPQLFGREQDLAELLALIDEWPLVSVTGPGGVGKTSLARELLARHGAGLGCAVHWVDLAPLRPEDALPPVVAAQLGVLGTHGDSPKDLLAALSRTQALIVLDNCEHMVTAVSRLVGAALEAAPDVRWVVTSQIPLHLLDEHVYQLQPLHTPARATAFGEAVRSGAVALLRARAAATYRPFELTPQNVDVAMDICRELDGLPLAIEMAASRIATLGLDTVRDQLSERLRLSSREPGGLQRHQTLSRTFDWSYGLLSETEQRVFRRLEPFLGGFTARMARQMACDDAETDDGPQPWEAVEALSVLVERSLVHRMPASPGRYFLFEGARDYARGRLGEAGEVQWAQRRHAEMMALCFAGARADLDRMRDADWAAKYLPERHNVRAALAWSCQMHEPDLLARLVAAMAQVDLFSRNQAEVVHSGVPLAALMDAAPRWRAPACVEFSWALYLDGDRKAAAELARRALDDFQALGDRQGAYQALAQFSRICEARPGTQAEAREASAALAALEGDDIPLRSRLFRGIMGGMLYDGGRTVDGLRALHDLAARSGYDGLAAVCRAHLTDQLLIDRRFAEVVEQTQHYEAFDEARPRVRAALLANLILALVELGREQEAVEPAQVVLRTFPAMSNHVVAAFALAAVRQGRLQDAALMMGYCDRMRRDRGQLADPAEAAAESEVATTLAQAFAAPRLAELQQLGGALSLNEVCAFIPQPRAATGAREAARPGLDS